MKKKTKMIFIFLGIIFTLILSGCSSAQAGGKKIIRISHGQPADHPDDQAVKAFAQHIHENLGDKYQVLVYDNGLLGDSKNALELCQTGAIDFVVCSTSNLEAYNRLYGLFSVPYLFSNEAAYFDFMNSDVASKMYDSTIESGFKVVTWFNAGQRSFYASKPIKTPADLKGMKIRVQPSPLNIAMMEALGAGAVPMGFGEVYTALQQGTIDAAENNELALTTVKHGEVAKYYSYDMHQMQPDMLVGNYKLLENLSDEERAIFEEGFEIAHQVEVEAWDIETEKAINTAKNDMSVTFVKTDTKAFQDACAHISQDYMKANPGTEIYFEEINKANAKNAVK